MDEEGIIEGTGVDVPTKGIDWEKELVDDKDDAGTREEFILDGDTVVTVFELPPTLGIDDTGALTDMTGWLLLLLLPVDELYVNWLCCWNKACTAGISTEEDDPFDEEGAAEGRTLVVEGIFTEEEEGKGDDAVMDEVVDDWDWAIRKNWLTLGAKPLSSGDDGGSCCPTPPTTGGLFFDGLKEPGNEYPLLSCEVNESSLITLSVSVNWETDRYTVVFPLLPVGLR